jgi:threonylcarbamoyladenosine tRNA methylthiotransferase MtaB
MSVEVITFGCRLNLQESAAIESLASGATRRTVVINSCAVTAEAVKQARQTIRKLHREDPDRQIIITGCAAQIEPATFADMPEVTAIVGQAEKARGTTWQSLLGSPEALASKTAFHSDIQRTRTIETPPAAQMDRRVRAVVQVQNGCDHRCTFCIIPYGRGPSRSVAMGKAVEQIKQLVGTGHREIVLTGVDMTSYGHDLPGKPSLGRLMEMILRHVPDLDRLRLSSIDCIEADPVLVDLMGSERRLMPHLHLSLQAGDNMILKRMKRRHLREDSIAFCQSLREKRPEIVFGADLIAGFPTEDDAMFENTLALVEDCGLTHLHVFPFSPRPGTPAARMPLVPVAVIKGRAARLREAGAERLRQHLESKQGQTQCVLAERGNIGRTEDFTPVLLPEGTASGTMFDAVIAGHDGRRLLLTEASAKAA